MLFVLSLQRVYVLNITYLLLCKCPLYSHPQRVYTLNITYLLLGKGPLYSHPREYIYYIQPTYSWVNALCTLTPESVYNGLTSDPHNSSLEV